MQLLRSCQRFVHTFLIFFFFIIIVVLYRFSLSYSSPISKVHALRTAHALALAKPPVNLVSPSLDPRNPIFRRKRGNLLLCNVIKIANQCFRVFSVYFLKLIGISFNLIM